MPNLKIRSNPRNNDGNRRSAGSAGWDHLEPDFSIVASDESNAPLPQDEWRWIFKLWALLLLAIFTGALGYFQAPSCSECALPNMLAWAGAHFFLTAMIVGGVFLCSVALVLFWRGGLPDADAKKRIFLLAEFRGLAKCLMAGAVAAGPFKIFLYSPDHSPDQPDGGTISDSYLALILLVAFILMAFWGGLRDGVGCYLEDGTEYYRPAVGLIALIPICLMIAMVGGWIVYAESDNLRTGFLVGGVILALLLSSLIKSLWRKK